MQGRPDHPEAPTDRSILLAANSDNYANKTAIGRINRLARPFETGSRNQNAGQTVQAELAKIGSASLAGALLPSEHLNLAGLGFSKDIRPKNSPKAVISELNNCSITDRILDYLSLVEHLHLAFRRQTAGYSATIFSASSTSGVIVPVCLSL